MIKARIVIASVLKPVTEPRAFHKLALSLRETNKYRINIIGFCSKKKPVLEDLVFTEILCRPRIHPLRLLASFKYLGEVFRYRPRLVIVTTYELLLPALVGKLFLRYRLIYDLTETCPENLMMNMSLSSGIGCLATGIICLIALAAHPFLDHYFFSAQVYTTRFPHIRDFTVLESKFAEPVICSGS